MLVGLSLSRHTVHGETGDYCRQLRIQRCLFHGLLQIDRIFLSLCPQYLQHGLSSGPVVSVEGRREGRLRLLDTTQSETILLYDWGASVTLV
jgi:hypothetical protein